MKKLIAFVLTFVCTFALVGCQKTMRGSEVYQKYMEFKKLKKTVDKIRKTIKEKGSTPELEKALSKAQEEANKSVR